ncbi:MAG TPA: YARHG domain-containing protein [Chryseosolibacter sp.]
MKFYNILLVVIVCLLGCKSEKEKAAEDFSKVRAVVNRLTQSFGGIDTVALKSLFETETKLPKIFLAQPEGISTTFILDEIEIEKDVTGIYKVTLPYKLTASDESFTEGYQEVTVVKTNAGEFKIIAFSSNLATSAIRLQNRLVAKEELSLQYDLLFKDSEAIASQLRKDYDSIVFVTAVGQTKLYYVANGEWKYPYSFKGAQQYTAKVGVVESSGKVIVPAKFDKVYNPDGTVASYIEVEENGKRGLYSIMGAEFLPAQYDVIYPSTKEDGVVCMVKQNGKIGKVNTDGSVSFSEGANGIKQLAPVLTGINFNFPGNVKVLHYPYSPDQYFDAPLEPNNAVIVTPSYLVDLGFTKEEYYPNLVPDGANMGTIEMSMRVKETVNFSDKVIAVFALFYESAIDARDYSFERTDLLTLDEKMNRVERVEGLCEKTHYPNLCDEESYRQVGPGLFEIRKVGASKIEPYHVMEHHLYYRLHDDGKVKFLETNRVFAFTKFVKMNNSYFNTCAYTGVDFAPDSRQKAYNTLIYRELSSADLDLMRNEIFAEYGYKFTSEKWKKYFSSKSWYKPEHDNVDNKLTDIDRHNIELILQYQKTLKTKEIRPDSILHAVAG